MSALPQAALAQDGACAAAAGDPAALTRLDEVALKAVLRELAQACPDVLRRLELPPSVIAPYLPQADLGDSAPPDAPLVLPPAPPAEPAIVAKLQGAAMRLASATDAVDAARMRLDRAIGRAERSTQRGLAVMLGLRDIAVSRRNAEVEVQAALTDLAAKKQALDTARTETQRLIDEAGATSKKTGGELTVALDGMTMTKAVDTLKSRIEMASKDTDSLEKSIGEITSKLAETTAKIAEIDELSGQTSAALKDARTANEAALAELSQAKTTCNTACTDALRVSIDTLSKRIDEGMRKADLLNKEVALYDAFKAVVAGDQSKLQVSLGDARSKLASVQDSQKTAIGQLDALDALSKADQTAKAAYDSAVAAAPILVAPKVAALAEAQQSLDKAVDTAAELVELTPEEQALVDAVKAAQADLDAATQTLATVMADSGAVIEAAADDSNPAVQAASDIVLDAMATAQTSLDEADQSVGAAQEETVAIETAITDLADTLSEVAVPADQSEQQPATQDVPDAAAAPSAEVPVTE